jgi:hypothetical protein
MSARDAFVIVAVDIGTFIEPSASSRPHEGVTQWLY